MFEFTFQKSKKECERVCDKYMCNRCFQQRLSPDARAPGGLTPRTPVLGGCLSLSLPGLGETPKQKRAGGVDVPTSPGAAKFMHAPRSRSDTTCGELSFWVFRQKI